MTEILFYVQNVSRMNFACVYVSVDDCGGLIGKLYHLTQFSRNRYKLRNVLSLWIYYIPFYGNKDGSTNQFLLQDAFIRVLNKDIRVFVVNSGVTGATVLRQ